SRVRVRRELLPLLEQLSPGIVTHLCALADMLGEGLVSSSIEPGLERLGRAQRQAVFRAQRLGRPAVRLLLRGGRERVLTFREGGAVLTQEAEGAPSLGRNRGRR